MVVHFIVVVSRAALDWTPLLPAILRTSMKPNELRTLANRPPKVIISECLPNASKKLGTLTDFLRKSLPLPHPSLVDLYFLISMMDIVHLVSSRQATQAALP